MDKSTLQESIDNIALLKKLVRKDATEFNITPHLELSVGGQHLGTKKNNYWGAVFSYQSSSIETINLNGKAERYVPILTGEDTLAYFLITILTVLYNYHLKSINPGSIFHSDIVGNGNKIADWSHFVSL